MARASKSKKRNSSSVAIPAKKTRKKRVGDVKNLVLKALQSGSLSRSALERVTGASYNALVMQLSKLKQEGLVSFDPSNRIVSLAGSGAGVDKDASAAQKAKSSKKHVAAPTLPTVPSLIAEAITLPAAPGYSELRLKAAIEQFVRRMEPIEAIEDKLLVLDHLSAQLGGPIGEVLAGIKADLLRS